MINFGPIKYLASHFMLPFLSFSYEHFIPNYGIAIILLTLLIKLAFFPLTQKQFKSMKAMQKIQPEMVKLKEKFKDNPKKQQTELMNLYKQHNVNPFAGCLPMLIQIPFFLAIYATVLGDSFKNLLIQPDVFPGLFPFWLSDLALPDSTYILPILLAGFTFWSQKLIMTDPKQKMFVYITPAFILYFGITLPSGAVLYWAVHTIISTLQQLKVTNQKEANVEIIKTNQERIKVT